MGNEIRILQPTENHFMPAAAYDGVTRPTGRALQDFFPVIRDNNPVCHRTEHAGISRVIHKPLLNFEQIIHIQAKDILRFFHTGQLKENIRHCRRCILIPDTLISSACHHNLTAEGFHLRPQQKRAKGLRSGGFPENGDPGDIPSEGFNIFPDPSQRGQLIQRTVITCMPVPFPQGFSQIQVSKHTQPVIY